MIGLFQLFVLLASLSQLILELGRFAVGVVLGGVPRRVRLLVNFLALTLEFVEGFRNHDLTIIMQCHKTVRASN